MADALEPYMPVYAGKRPVARQLVQRAAGNTAATYVTRLA